MKRVGMKYRQAIKLNNEKHIILNIFPSHFEKSVYLNINNLKGYAKPETQSNLFVL
jgi:hypothetical protein